MSTTQWPQRQSDEVDVVPEGHLADALAGRREDRVGKRRGGRGNRWFADAADVLLIFQSAHDDLRGLPDPHPLGVVVVHLLRRAVGEGDFARWGPHGEKVAVKDGKTIYVVNADGSGRTQKTVGEDGRVAFEPVTQQVPIYQMIWPGGDVSVVGNVEYRIPIFGPVTLALFADAARCR